MKTEPHQPLYDEILAGIHAAREEHAAALKFDIHALCEESRREEKLLAAAGWKIVNLVRGDRPPTPQPA